jgi:hypothetical protein
LSITDPGFRIPDPKTVTKEKDEKKFDVLHIFVAANITKLKFFSRRKNFAPIKEEF